MGKPSSLPDTLGSVAWAMLGLAFLTVVIAPVVILGFVLGIATLFGAGGDALDELRDDVGISGVVRFGFTFAVLWPLIGWVCGLVAAVQRPARRSLWAAFAANLVLWIACIVAIATG